MQLTSKYDKGFRLFLYVIDIFNKNSWLVPLNNRKVITIFNDLQKILDQSNRKPNKIWGDKGSEFYNTSMESWLHDNDIKIQHIVKENLLLLKDLVEPYRTKFANL